MNVLRIPQSFSITGISSSDWLASYLAYSSGGLTPLKRSGQCILQLQPTGQLMRRRGSDWKKEFMELTFFFLLKHEIYTVFSTYAKKCSHKDAINLWRKEVYIRRNKIINKHIFQWIYLSNGVKILVWIIDVIYFGSFNPEYGEACGWKKSSLYSSRL